VKKTPAQLDAEIAESLTSKAASARRPPPPPPKHRKYDINPSSPEVIKAFLKSNYTADEVGIQEFIAKRYLAWMRQTQKRYPDMDVADEWTAIISEFTAALRKHGVHVED
jgi:hypothetical protein